MKAYKIPSCFPLDCLLIFAVRARPIPCGITFRKYMDKRVLSLQILGLDSLLVDGQSTVVL